MTKAGANTNLLEFEGRVTKCLPGAKFIVELVSNNHQITCTISGRMRRNYIRLVPGDMVMVVISPYDLLKGRITFRKTTNRTAAMASPRRR